MTTLDRLVEIEKRLDDGGLLRDNYDGLTKESGQECAKLLIEYMGLAQSVRHKHIIFIKELTKVANHILNPPSNFLDDQLEKLYKFNEEGIENIEARFEEYALEDLGQDRLTAMRSHLYSHAGNVARRRFELAKERDESLVIQIEWVKKWYDNKITSAEMIVKTEPAHSAHSYSFAADAAKKRAQLAKEIGESLDVQIDWWEKGHDANEESSDMTFVTEPKHSAHTSLIAGNMAIKLSELTGLEKWKYKAIWNFGRFVRYYDDLDFSMSRSKLVEDVKYRIIVLGQNLLVPSLKRALPKYLFEELFGVGSGKGEPDKGLTPLAVAYNKALSSTKPITSKP